MPDDFIDARMTPRRLMIMLKAVMTDRARVRKLLALKRSLAAPGRAWQRLDLITRVQQNRLTTDGPFKEDTSRKAKRRLLLAAACASKVSLQKR